MQKRLIFARGAKRSKPSSHLVPIGTPPPEYVLFNGFSGSLPPLVLVKARNASPV